MNHHGRVRTLDADGNEVEPDEENIADPGSDNISDALQNNWVGGAEPLQLALISRHEDVQVGLPHTSFLTNLSGCSSEGALQQNDSKREEAESSGLPWVYSDPNHREHLRGHLLVPRHDQVLRSRGLH